MSGVVHAISKVFKAVVNVAKDVVHFVAHNWKTIAIAAAVIYTGGLAAGAWGGAAASAGGAAATGAAAATGTAADTVGIMAGSTAASSAAAATGGVFGIGSATIGTTAAADLAAGIGAGGIAAGGSLAATGAGYSLASSGAPVTDLGAVNVTAATGPLSQGASFSGLQGPTLGTGGAFTAATQSFSMDPNAAQNNLVTGQTTSNGASWWDHSKSIMDNMRTDASRIKGDIFDKGAYTSYNNGVQTAAGNASNAGDVVNAADSAGKVAASGGGSSAMDTFAKLQIASTLLKTASGYFAGKAQYAAPRNFSGRGPGGGAGIGMHTTPNGMFLQAGGQQPTGGGVPDALLPPGATPQQTGSALSDSALGNSSSSSPGNLGQTVANSAGVGGLIPQGAVNYMGGGHG